MAFTIAVTSRDPAMSVHRTSDILPELKHHRQSFATDDHVPSNVTPESLLEATGRSTFLGAVRYFEVLRQ